MDNAFLKATDEALSDEIHISLKSANDGLKNTSFRFVACVLNALALKRALNAILDNDIGIWAYSSFFMDMFAPRLLTSEQFVRPDAKFFERKLKLV